MHVNVHDELMFDLSANTEANCNYENHTREI